MNGWIVCRKEPCTDERCRLLSGTILPGMEASGKSSGNRQVGIPPLGPGARSVSVVGDFNDWKQGVSPMHRRPDGLWECSVSNAWEGQKYKYAVEGAFGGIVLKADPYARKAEPFGTASILFAPAPYPWTDEDYLHHLPNAHKSPMNIYEVHLGSWKKGFPTGSWGIRLFPMPGIWDIPIWSSCP